MAIRPGSPGLRLAATLLGVVALTAGCSTKTEPAAPQSPPSASSVSTGATAARVNATTVRQFDPQWMDLSIPKGWTESNRRITGEFQQFGLRPPGETELPRGCNGCGTVPPTAYVTVYAAGKFDPAQARSGDPVTVNADGDGFIRTPPEAGGPVLTWQYADNSWATVRGTTTLTSQSDRLLELARALHPGELTAIRVPLSLPGVPATMPLAEINVDNDAYGTTLTFAQCGGTDLGGIRDCQVASDSLRVQIWPTDDPSGHVPQGDSIPATIGGRAGSYGADGKSAAVQVGPGMLTVFELSGGSALKDILATLAWAPDPGSRQTWPPVAEWTTQN